MILLGRFVRAAFPRGGSVEAKGTLAIPGNAEFTSEVVGDFEERGWDVVAVSE